MEEIDVWRTAHVVMTQQGERAALVAAARADALFAKNDFAGSAVFHRVFHAIFDLERMKPRPGQAVN